MAISLRQTYTGNLLPAKIRLANQPDQQFITGKHKACKAKTGNRVFPKTHEGYRYTPFTLETHAFFEDTKVLFQLILQRCGLLINIWQNIMGVFNKY